MARRWWPAGAALSRGRSWPAGAPAPPLLLLRACPRARPRALPRRASRRRPTQLRPAPRLRLRSRLECERSDPHVICLAELLCIDLDTSDYGFDLVVESVRDNDSVPDDKNFLLRDHDDKPFCVCLDAQPVLDFALGCVLVPDAPTLHNLEPKTAAHTDDPVLDDKHFLLHDPDDKPLCYCSDALRRAFGPDVPILHCLVPNFADLHDNDTVTDDKPFLQNDPNDEMHLPDLEPGLAPEHDTDVPPQLMRDLQMYYKANRMDFGGCCPLGCGATDFAGHFRSCRFVLCEVKVTMRGLIADDPCAAQFPRALDPDKMLFAPPSQGA
mmetsp:Transcript_80188/g.259826  ORF Transcript_80188/g.259826 Transcript_80188/m.259826 type:complete len:325 (+) Transcript_80188:96-1070(+)